MFPGNSGSTYNNQYAAPSGPPPGYTGGYDRPAYNQQQYERPNCPPPSQSTNRGDFYNYDSNENSNVVGGITYQNPASAPPMPSSQMMSYQYNGQGGQNVQNFQYSQCDGVKKALIVGINYIGTQNELRGCINDAHNMRQFLTANGYPEDNIVMLTDDQSNYMSVPTRENMLHAMQWLVQDARPGDSLFFHYSGHGGQEEDKDGDEADGMDDCIYPVDFQQSGSIIDDILHDVMVKPLPAGCRLTAIFDSCHSGTVLDLPFVYRAKDGGLKEYNIWKESSGDAMNIVMGYATRDPMEMFNGAKNIFNRVTAHSSGNSEEIKKQKMSAADVIMFSGCKDSQTSADAQEAGNFTGALSWAYIKVMSQNSVQSYLTLLQNLRTVLATKYTQKPQLSSSHQIDPNYRFIF